MVKPIWLLMTDAPCRRCSSPEVCAKFKASPSPRPGRRTPRRRGPTAAAPSRAPFVAAPVQARLDRAPTTGLTISRCDGLNASDRCTGPPGVVTRSRSPGGTSRRRRRLENRAPSGRTRRTAWSGSCRAVLTSTFRRPRCAMPITIFPARPGTGADHLSIDAMRSLAALPSEKRFWPTSLVQVALQALRSGQALGGCGLLLGREVRLRADRLQRCRHQRFGRSVGDVHVHGADRAAVWPAQRLFDLAQRHVLVGREVAGWLALDTRCPVGCAESVERRLELGDLRRRGA